MGLISRSPAASLSGDDSGDSDGLVLGDWVRTDQVSDDQNRFPLTGTWMVRGVRGLGELHQAHLEKSAPK